VEFNYLNVLIGFIIAVPGFLFFFNSMLKVSKDLKSSDIEDKENLLKKTFLKKAIIISAIMYLLIQFLGLEGLLGSVFAFFIILKRFPLK
jgi:hypothetical protein